MELQFDKSLWNCLHRATRQMVSQEETQEVRLPDGMPDIGRVLGAWGQVLLRSKEWRTGSAGVSGGVMAWVLYEPEGEDPAQWVEAWIPFQMKWDFPATQRDGTVLASCILRSMDARSLSARKLMLRAGIGCLLEAYAPDEVELYNPGELPEDIQVLRRTYPLCMPVEAGEKPFALDEELTLPAASPKLQRLVRYSLTPELIDRKVMADKLVFRGAAYLHILYQGDNGEFHSWDFEIPFSQYAELEKEYEQDATAKITMAVTSLEAEQKEDGALNLKAGLTAQYIINKCQMAEVVEDAYSPRRMVACQRETVAVPMVLEEKNQSLRPEVNLPTEGIRIADTAFYPDYPLISADGNQVQGELSGNFQMLSYDGDGNIMSETAPWQDTWQMPADADSQVELMQTPGGKVQGTIGGGNANLHTDATLEATTIARQGLPMVIGLELGELSEPDPGRPTLILRRAGNEDLWQIAKNCGSTVADIQKANQLQEEPTEGQMLLIPVL